MNGWEAFLAIAGLAAVTVITRAFFLFPERELSMPDWVRRGLRYAPLAALAAVVVPEVLFTDGRLIHTWRDPQLAAVAVASAWFFWRRGILGTIVSGMAVLLALHLGLGW